MKDKKEQGFLILDRSEFETEWEYQAALGKGLRDRNNPPLRKYTDDRRNAKNG